MGDDSAPSYTFRDAGLHSRLLRGVNAVGAGLRWVGFDVPSLEPDSIARAACDRAGLEDFGDPGWREGLEVLCLALELEGNLTTFGRIAMRGLITNALEGRLRLIDWAARHPEVRDEKIERPWVVVGLPRTGTTLLSLLLALDPEVRPLLHWESTSPVPPPDLATHAEDPRIAAAAKQVAQIEALNPAIRAMHPMGATIATECVGFLFFDLRSLLIETQAHLPSYGRWLEKTDMHGAYAMHRLALQVLQSRIPTPVWSLKTPQHLWSLDTLLEFYPDARIVWTHRDPTKVVTSVASLNTSLQRLNVRTNDPLAIGADWNDKLHLAVTRGHRVRPAPERQGLVSPPPVRRSDGRPRSRGARALRAFRSAGESAARAAHGSVGTRPTPGSARPPRVRSLRLWPLRREHRRALCRVPAALLGSRRSKPHGRHAMSWGEGDIPDLSNRVAVVTGANSGIGFETARALAAKGARVILGCRSRTKGPQAAARIREATPGADVLFASLDLASQKSIAMFAKEVSSEVDRLDILCNNAGVMMPPLDYTRDGFELQFGINHLGHFALTAHLMPLLRTTPGARVVTVSSLMHFVGWIHFADLNSMKRYNATLAYGQSKVANLLFARELARRLGSANLDVISAAAHPGSTRTELQRHSELMHAAVRVFAQDAPAGALPTLYAATAPDVRGGDYFGPRLGLVGPPARALSSPLAQNRDVARKLWDVSEQLTGVKFDL